MQVFCQLGLVNVDILEETKPAGTLGTGDCMGIWESNICPEVQEYFHVHSLCMVHFTHDVKLEQLSGKK